jgi:ubiquitin carboxyl-terminal hydrolase 5/13
MSAMSSARQSEVKAWEEEIAACEHTFLLQQIPPDQGSAPGMIVVDSHTSTLLVTLCRRRSFGTLQPM